MKYFPFANYRFDLISQIKLFFILFRFANQGYLMVNMTPHLTSRIRERFVEHAHSSVFYLFFA